MRVVLLSLALLSALLSGCAGGDGGTDCDSADTAASGTEACATTSTTTTTTCYTPPGSSGTCGPVPPTTGPPNQPPRIVLAVTDANGTATNATYPGVPLFFDASASTDPDGTLEIVAMDAQDGNRTYPPQILFDGAAFRPANYTFDRPGPVTVRVSGIDSRGDVTTITATVHVNFRALVGDTYLFTGAAHEAVVHASDCHGPTDGAQPAVDALVWTSHGFPVQNGTMSIQARIVSGSATIALCAPDGTALTEDSTESVATPAGTTFQEAPALGGYYVSVYSKTPNQHVPIEVSVYYSQR